MTLRSPSLVAALLAACAPSTARANGRFPDAQQLVVSPIDDDVLLLQATFGLVLSTDGARTWRWGCERAIGYIGELDPPVAIASSGRLFAALFDGLATAEADGCSWSYVGEPIGTRFVVDVSARRGHPDDVVALATNGVGNLEFDSRFFRSGDGGVSFAQVGEPLPTDFLGETVDVAPSEPRRVYVSGLRATGEGSYVGVFGRSDDGGASFELQTIEGSDGSSGPYLAAVDPVDPEVVYVRLAGPGGRLLRSEDAGATFTTIATLAGTLQGFALSPDGGEIAIGGPTDGLRVGSADGAGLLPVGSVKPRCLTWTDGGLYACGSETVEGFTLGFSTDRGASFSEVFSRLCLEGPIECPAGTSVREACEADWPAARALIGADLCPVDASTVQASSATASSSAASGEAGQTPAPGGTDACCTVAPGAGSSASGHAALLSAAAWLATFVRRRRRDRT